MSHEPHQNRVASLAYARFSPSAQNKEIDKNMSRFAEVTRIENAIKAKNRVELQWALEYSTYRISICKRKDHIKYWINIKNQIEAAIDDQH